MMSLYFSAIYLCWLHCQKPFEPLGGGRPRERVVEPLKLTVKVLAVYNKTQFSK